MHYSVVHFRVLGHGQNATVFATLQSAWSSLDPARIKAQSGDPFRGNSSFISKNMVGDGFYAVACGAALKAGAGGFASVAVVLTAGRDF